MNIAKKYIEVNQPIGTFYLTSFTAEEILKTTSIVRREYDNDNQRSNNAVQRMENSNRVKNISEFCKDPDLSFPTPIIIAVDSNKIEMNEDKIIFSLDTNIGEIIDGQHRILGIKMSQKLNIELPVVLMFDLTKEEKAYVFSTINSNQVTVPKSLIYDLYDISEKRSPFKTCHEIARALNSNEDSPFHNKLKMLGKKQSENETLSQGTFVNELVKLISKNPQKDEIDIKNGKILDVISIEKYPLRNYFINDKDDIIYKILLNVFSALRDVFPDEWNDNKNSILVKTTGYGGVIKSLSTLITFGRSNNNLSEEFFFKVFSITKQTMEKDNLKFDSEHFPSNEQNQKKLAKLIESSIDSLNDFA